MKIARFVLGLAWIYQGLVPKLLFLAPTEQAMWQSLGPDDATIRILIYLAGFLEIIFGLMIILFYRSPRVHYLNLWALGGLLLATAIFEPHFMNDAFNPVTTNIPLMALSLIAISEMKRAGRFAGLLK